jgi:PTH1 family peptidyl-tRNA hydrolase
VAGEQSDRWLVVGLGNPGDEYKDNRHNIGFIVVERLATQSDASWKRAAKHRAEMATGQLSRRPVVLLKPQTYMNLSGESVGPAAHYYRITSDRVIAVHDDIDLELGRLKVKLGGGDGGHKGIRSIAQHLGGPDFVRVRVGVGRPRHGDVTNFVLGGFHREEREAAEDAVARAAKAVRLVITRGVTEAMNRLNRPPRPRKPTSTSAAGDGEQAHPRSDSKQGAAQRPPTAPSVDPSAPTRKHSGS